MTIRLKIIRFEGIEAVILPQEVLRKLGAKVGNSLHLHETESGFQLSYNDSEFLRQSGLAEEIMREDFDVLRDLVQ